MKEFVRKRAIENIRRMGGAFAEELNRVIPPPPPKVRKEHRKSEDPEVRARREAIEARQRRFEMEVAEGKRNPTDIERAEKRKLEAVMLQMHVQGKRVATIAKELQLDFAFVARHLKKAIDREADTLSGLASRELLVQLQRVDEMYEQVYEMWRESCGERKDSRVKLEAGGETDSTGKTPNPRRITQTNGTKKGLGEPRYIAELRALQDRKLKLLGLDRPDTIQVTLANITNNSYTANFGTQVSSNTAPIYSPAELQEIADTARMLGLGFDNEGGVIDITPARDYTPVWQGDDVNEDDDALEASIPDTGAEETSLVQSGRRA